MSASAPDLPQGESKSASLNAPTPPDDYGDADSSPYTTEQAREGLRGLRVVIVEDEGVTQMQLRRTLAHSGLIIAATAINGRDGVTAVLRERPDIVLMDIRMPVMDGIEAARAIMAEYPVCIVMLTAFSDEDYREQTRQMGVTGYVVKPITSDLLLPLMLRALEEFRNRATP